MIQFNNTKIFTDNIDQPALAQLHELDKTGVFTESQIRIMPDCHAGAGCVIGFTAPVKDKIIPNLVGVDIGCGMLCVNLGKIDMDYALLDDIIRDRIPSGRAVSTFSDKARGLIEQLRCKDHLTNRDWLECSLGTLGGGNHFIEIDEGQHGEKYLVIHSGSRNLGKQVADYYQDRAAKEYRSASTTEVIAELKAQGREKEIADVLKAMKAEKPKLPRDLCYLQGDSMDEYLNDMQICTNFADLNRETIAVRIISNYAAKWYNNGKNPQAMEWGKSFLRHRNGWEFDWKKCAFTTRHNYISLDGYIRKGAISAKKGERVLIPLNMRDGCIIGIGKGNPDWNYSAPHGAGRIMSRSEAKKTLKLEDFQKTMVGIYSTSISAETIDEAPFAYKPSEEIIELVEDTVFIEQIIKPVHNYKASE